MTTVDDEAVFLRSGVHVRPIVEIVEDCTCCDGSDGDCIRFSIAASWPEPHPWSDLGEDR